MGDWYWSVDEIEAASFMPRLVHARKAKLMLGMLNKTDKLDARGLNRLQRTGALPTVWIPPGELRDRGDLPLRTTGTRHGEPSWSWPPANGELRGYQRDGLGWLQFLEQFGFGGCLADDMGLGKTVQVLAFLELRRDRAGEASLVVVPRRR